MSIDNKSDDMFYLTLLFTLFENQQKEWDQLRNKEIDLLKLAQKEYTDYFNKLFKYGIPRKGFKSLFALKTP